MTASPIADAVRAELDARVDPQRAAAEAGYLRSELRHLGTGVPAVRRAVTAARRAAAPLDRATVLAAVRSLWADPVHEHRLAAIELLIAEQACLDPATELATVEAMLRTCRTWALLDPLAAKVAGPLLDRLDRLDRLDPLDAGVSTCAAGAGGLAGDVLDRWIADEDFWVRRAALLAHLEALRAGGGDFERFGRLADRVLEEREFFIRKAIGWVLRDTGRRRPELVAAWVAPRRGRLSGVTRREVRKVVADL